MQSVYDGTTTPQQTGCAGKGRNLRGSSVSGVRPGRCWDEGEARSGGGGERTSE